MSRQPIGEVIQEFADGGYYIKNKLDTLARDLLNAEYAKSEAGKKTKQEEGNGSGKVDDTHVQFLVNEFEVSRSEAEASLRLSNGDLTKTVERMVSLPAQ